MPILDLSSAVVLNDRGTAHDRIGQFPAGTPSLID